MDHDTREDTAAAASPSNAGGYRVSIGDAGIDGSLKSTGSWENFKIEPVGKLHLAAGRQTLTVRPTLPGAAVMNVRDVVLTKVK